MECHRTALPCGSVSMNTNLQFFLAKLAAKFIAVVDLPTPPF
jgi:hypothetical protein